MYKRVNNYDNIFINDNSIYCGTLCNSWMDSWDISIRAMLNLIIFIAVYMISNRYLKNLRD